MRKLLMSAILFLALASSGQGMKKNHLAASHKVILRKEDKVGNALKFINAYVDNSNKMSKAINIMDWVNADKLTTKSFKDELKKVIVLAHKKDPALGLHSDPILDAQDTPDKGFELESFDEKSGYLVVKDINSPKFKVTMKVINQNGNWLVDGCGIINIPTEKRASKLRQAPPGIRRNGNDTPY